MPNAERYVPTLFIVEEERISIRITITFNDDLIFHFLVRETKYVITLSELLSLCLSFILFFSIWIIYLLTYLMCISYLLLPWTNTRREVFIEQVV